MGLGKTVQVAVAIADLHRSAKLSRALVIAPASLLLNWEREICLWAPELIVRRIQGQGSERRYEYLLPTHVAIASYEQVRSDAISMDPRMRFDVVVLDEAQRIKNANSETALACRIVPRTRSWALTGTPVENSAADLIAIFRFVAPGVLSAGMLRDDLHDRMRPYFLRRRKADVLEELPSVINQEIPLELTRGQRRSYDDIWLGRRERWELQGPSGEMQLLAAITRLKQICNYDPITGESSKLDALMAILDDLRAGDKVLVFSQYVETLRWLAGRVNEHLPCEVFHGGLSQTERDRVLHRFREGQGRRGLLVSLRAGSTGLNLPEATHVVDPHV